MKKILFQGDSITDCHRLRDDADSLGQGYPNMIAGCLGYAHPQEYQFVNKGISGDRVVDLYARWKRDCWNLSPDYISVLVGVNDVWHELDTMQNGVDVARFKHLYSMLIEETQSRLPSCRFILMEPFVLPGSATIQLGFDQFYQEVVLRQQAVAELSTQYKLPLVRLQEHFDAAAKLAPPEYWLRDGVHPTPMGHALIAEHWQRLFAAMQ